MIVYLCEYGRDDPMFIALTSTPEAAIAACKAHHYFTYEGRYGDFGARAIEVDGDEVGVICFGVWQGREIIKAGKAGEFLSEFSDPEWAAQPYW